jgi:tetratricopeptide (TPR) repeat protein
MKRSACWFVLSFLCCCAVSGAADSAAVQAVRTCGYEGERLYKNGSFNAARLQWEKGLELARGMKNAELVDHFQTNLGIVYAELGEYKKAIGCFERSLVTARARNDLPVVAATLGSLGNAAASLGDYKQALTSYEASLAQFRGLNDTPNIATALSNIGNVHARQADFAAAGRCYEEALRLTRELNDQTGKGNNLANLGNVYAKLGDYEKALYFSGEAQKIFEEQNYRPGLAACATNLGVIYNDLGDYRRALLHYEEALQLAKLLGSPAPSFKFDDDPRGLPAKPNAGLRRSLEQMAAAQSRGAAIEKLTEWVSTLREMREAASGWELTTLVSLIGTLENAERVILGWPED